MSVTVTRRDAVKALAAGVGSAVLLASRATGARQANPRELRIELEPKHELSPHLFMQFMEPLGVTDSSVEAAWDHEHDVWRRDVVEISRELEPTMLRWGGIFTDFYRWREEWGRATSAGRCTTSCGAA
jgi:alpha-L-arabinofuranosidase